ncbi:hypothetical protein HZ77_001260 [Escherichia coli]|nr:hypothetical protein [Escherichia coli]
MSSKVEQLRAQLNERILVLDGGMGTMIQSYRLNEADFRGERFADWPCDLKGNNDLLVLSKPEVIAAIHNAYFEAGADIIETNTFNSTTIAMADYQMESLSAEINFAAAKLARACADEWTARTPEKPRYVAGVLGPTNRTASISPDVNDPAFRNITFDGLVAAYRESTKALVEGGADLILIETVFDTLNAKAAVFAVKTEFEALGVELPIMISGTITDASGRTLSGQTTEAFYNSLRHAEALTFGLNCALGPDELRQYVQELSRIAECYVTAHPNAGLPNAFGEYDLDADTMAKQIREWAQAGFLNIVGGCCGTTPQHIAAMSRAVEGLAPRKLPEIPVACRLSGLFPANRVGDDIEIYRDETRTHVINVSHHLRQQTEKTGFANYCLADFVAPKLSGKADYIGAFAVTGGLEEDALADAFEAQHDDYNKIMVKALADRLAEAFAEYLHERVRKVYWGYAPNENLSNEELIRENYQGIRPAPGYPACPEHTEKATIWELLEVEKHTGMKLTESFAMWPGASVSGWYFSHPDSKYYAVAQIQRDQVEDYARRKGMSVTEVERWLAPNLGYDAD